MTELEQALAYARDVGLTDRHIAAAVKAAADQARFDNQPGTVRLYYPDPSVQDITVPADAVEGHLASGWQLEPPVEEEPAPVKASRTKKTEE